jgi:hypothetical protein
VSEKIRRRSVGVAAEGLIFSRLMDGDGVGRSGGSDCCIVFGKKGGMVGF